jgi:hypothetical protein
LLERFELPQFPPLLLEASSLMDILSRTLNLEPPKALNGVPASS